MDIHRFVEAFRLFKSRSGYSSVYLMRKTGIKELSIRAWRKGTAIPTRNELLNVAQSLRTSIDETNLLLSLLDYKYLSEQEATLQISAAKVGEPVNLEAFRAKQNNPIEYIDVYDAARAAVSNTSEADSNTKEIQESDSGIIIKDVKTGETARLDFNSAYERIFVSTNFTINQLESGYAQINTQATGWYRTSLFVAITGFVMIISGSIAVLMGNTTTGVIITLSSLIPDVSASLFFLQYRKANERMDAILGRVSEAKEITSALEIADTIDNAEIRNNLKAEIVRRTLGTQTQK